MLMLRLLMLVVLMRISQAPVFSNQVLHLPLEIVDSLPLCLYEALLVLHDGRQLFQIKHGFHGVVQQTLHRYPLVSELGVFLFCFFVFFRGSGRYLRNSPCPLSKSRVEAV